MRGSVFVLLGALTVASVPTFGVGAASLLTAGGVPSIHPKSSNEQYRGFAPSIQTMAVTPEGTIFAGSFGMGMFRSRDQGVTWELWNVGLKDPFLLCLVVVPDRYVYAGTVRGGVFRQKLGGSEWKPVAQGLGDAEVRSFVHHASTVFAGTGKGVFRWEEERGEWVRVGKGLNQVLVSGLAVLDRQTLLAATAGKGLFRFDLQGPDDAEWENFDSVFVDPKERLPHRYLRVIAVNESRAIFLGSQNGGMFFSSDQGKTWRPIGRRLPNDSIRSIVPIGQDLLVGTGNGIFRWDHHDREWVALNAGLLQKSIQSLLVTSDLNFFAGTSSGAFRTVDGGSHWSDMSQGFGIQQVPRGPYQ